MAETEPEYLSKFRKTLNAALNELPSDADLIMVLTDVLERARGDIRNYQVCCQRLEFETINLRRELARLKETVSDVLK